MKKGGKMLHKKLFLLELGKKNRFYFRIELPIFFYWGSKNRLCSFKENKISVENIKLIINILEEKKKL